MARAHVVIADELLAAIDALAGERGRSRFLEDAAREKLARLELEATIRDTSGIASEDDYPHWADREQTAAWVRATRGTESAA